MSNNTNNSSRDRERTAARQALQNRQPPPPTPAQAVEAAQRVLQTLKSERERLAARAAELAESCQRTSFAAHGLHDPEASRELTAMRGESLHAAQILNEHDHAVAEAEARLARAQQAQANAERKAIVAEQLQQCAEYRKVGPFADKALTDLRRAILALAENSRHVGRDFRHVETMWRTVAISLNGTPFGKFFPQPDANHRRSFSTFVGVVNGWCDSYEANLRRELAMLDGENTSEAA